MQWFLSWLQARATQREAARQADRQAHREFMRIMYLEAHRRRKKPSCLEEVQALRKELTQDRERRYHATADYDIF
jgi:hypothetical protein